MTALVASSVADAVAQIRELLADGTSCIMLNAPVGVGKTAIINALLSEPALRSSRRSVKRDIAELDQLQVGLDHSDGVLVLYKPVSYSSRPDASTALTTSIASLVDATDHPWSSAVGSLPAGQLIPLDAGQRTPDDTAESVMFAIGLHNVSSPLTFGEHIFARLRHELRRLISRMRIVLRLRLIYVLSGLSRIPDAINLVLLLLAASRCYGRRTEPSDYILPVSR